MKQAPPQHLQAFFLAQEEIAEAEHTISPSLLAQWKDLWNSAPRHVRRDLTDLACATPLLCGIFWLLWIALP